MAATADTEVKALGTSITDGPMATSTGIDTDVATLESMQVKYSKYWTNENEIDYSANTTHNLAELCIPENITVDIYSAITGESTQT